jgi:hypothetical protein
MLSLAALRQNGSPLVIEVGKECLLRCRLGESDDAPGPSICSHKLDGSYNVPARQA